jgi:hypothetical protein
MESIFEKTNIQEDLDAVDATCGTVAATEAERHSEFGAQVSLQDTGLEKVVKTESKAERPVEKDTPKNGTSMRR